MRLKAFEQFLTKYPEFQEKVSIIMIVVPSRDNVGQYRDLKEEVDLLVGRVNGKFGKLNWTPVHYFYRSFTPESLSAFYRMAHVALVTPMRDGMNLVAKEYVAAQDPDSVLVVPPPDSLSPGVTVVPLDSGVVVVAMWVLLRRRDRHGIVLSCCRAQSCGPTRGSGGTPRGHPPPRR